VSQTKIGIIASGSGSNAEAIMEACESGILNGLAEVVTLICNKNGAYCLERAQNHGIPCILIESEGFDGTREEFDRRLVAELTSAGVNVVCLIEVIESFNNSVS